MPAALSWEAEKKGNTVGTSRAEISAGTFPKPKMQAKTFPKVCKGAQQLQELEAKCGAKACLSDLFEISILAKCLGKVQTK